jgi:hypothetical protein
MSTPLARNPERPYAVFGRRAVYEAETTRLATGAGVEGWAQRQRRDRRGARGARCIIGGTPGYGWALIFEEEAGKGAHAND